MGKSYKYVLFDLDGTVTDSREGIVRSVAYSLEYFGIKVDDLDSLCCFIGPPLRGSYEKYFGFSKANAEKAIEKFRERFAPIGIYENSVYPAMTELLEYLKKQGKTVAIATSKPLIFANRILEHFGIGKYFDFVFGCDLDGSHVEKTEVVAEVLKHFEIEEKDKASVIMVGDRDYDIIGANENGIDSVGVLYGFGSYEELKKAGATYIAATVGDLATYL